ncbi:MAG: TrkH family potassium uptake protein, partial [Desulfofustis sp.]|nr:TrkH family potassium uptake protein [Desulfofustis sp.]
MNLACIAHVLSTLLLVTGGSLLLPVLCSLFYGENDLWALSVSALAISAAGLLLRFLFRHFSELSFREGVLVAASGWVIISALSTMPFLLHGSIDSFTDAYFEMMSGYTTTGASILTDIEALPHGLLFWRSQTHLLGGMGFLTLTLIFLPHGMGSLRIFRAESSPGQVITREKFVARNRDAMIWLWSIYLGLNLLQTIFLLFGGMDLFDALCTAFGTVSTSGYSPKNASIGHYDSPYIDWVVTTFMFLGGVTFLLYYQLLRGQIGSVLANTEFRWYVVLVVVFCGAVSLDLWTTGTYESFAEALRFGSFQVTSLLTTTGFTTADYERWPQAAQMFLFTVCFIGACAGSTTSGIKVVHYVIICKYLYGAIKKIYIQPLSVLSVRLNGRPVERIVIDLAVCYFVVNIFMVLLGGCVMVLSDRLDYLSAMSTVISSLMNIGPGFGAVGPSENFAFLSDFGKWY